MSDQYTADAGITVTPTYIRIGEEELTKWPNPQDLSHRFLRGDANDFISVDEGVVARGWLDGIFSHTGRRLNSSRIRIASIEILVGTGTVHPTVGPFARNSDGSGINCLPIYWGEHLTPLDPKMPKTELLAKLNDPTNENRVFKFSARYKHPEMDIDVITIERAEPSGGSSQKKKGRLAQFFGFMPKGAGEEAGKLLLRAFFSFVLPMLLLIIVLAIAAAILFG